MAVTQADIDALNTAIAQGERQVMIGAKQITYRSIAELIAARNDLRNELAALTATSTGKSIRIRPSGRGY
jgi:hypothetical protein